MGCKSSKHNLTEINIIIRKLRCSTRCSTFFASCVFKRFVGYVEILIAVKYTNCIFLQKKRVYKLQRYFKKRFVLNTVVNAKSDTNIDTICVDSGIVVLYSI